MGLFDAASGGKSYYESSTEAFLNPNAHSSHRRGVSPARSTRSVKTSASSGYFVRPGNTSASHSRPGYARSASGSMFGNFGGSNLGGSTSRGIFTSGGSSSYYKRSPRKGYISYLFNKLQRMIKELWYYARRHPVKAFFAVVVPLLSAGGAIHGLLRQFGFRVPILDGATRSLGGGYYGSSGYGGDGGSLIDSLGGASGLLSMVKMFM